MTEAVYQYQKKNREAPTVIKMTRKQHAQLKYELSIYLTQYALPEEHEGDKFMGMDIAFDDTLEEIQVS